MAEPPRCVLQERSVEVTASRVACSTGESLGGGDGMVPNNNMVMAHGNGWLN